MAEREREREREGERDRDRDRERQREILYKARASFPGLGLVGLVGDLYICIGC